MSLPARRKSVVTFTERAQNKELLKNDMNKRSTISRLAKEHVKDRNATNKEENNFEGGSMIVNGEELSLLHMCVITLENRVCSCSIALTRDCIRIQAVDCRSYLSHCDYMSYACVACLMVDFVQVHQLHSLFGYQRQFWNEYAHTLRMIGPKCQIFPSPVTTKYLLSTSSKHKHSMLIYESNTILSGVLFRIEFHSELETNILEIALKQQNNDYLGNLKTEKKPDTFYRIESIYLKKLFMENCIEGVISSTDMEPSNLDENANGSAITTGASANAVTDNSTKVLNPILFFDKLKQDIMYSRETNSFLVTCIENEKLKIYANTKISTETVRYMDTELALELLSRKMKKYVEQSGQQSGSESENDEDCTSKKKCKRSVGVAEQKHSELIEKVMQLQVLKREELGLYDDSSDEDDSGDPDESCELKDIKDLSEALPKDDSTNAQQLARGSGSAVDPAPVVPINRQRSHNRRVANIKHTNNTYSFHVIIETLHENPTERLSYYKRQPIVNLLKSCIYLSQCMKYCAIRDFDELAMHAKAIQCAPNEIIIKEGDYGEYCYIVIKGIVNGIDRHSVNQKVSTRYQEGDFIGKQFLSTSVTNANIQKTNPSKNDVASTKQYSNSMIYHETLQSMSHTYLCAIPIPLLLAHVGLQYTHNSHYANGVQSGRKQINPIRDMIKLFWKYTKLYKHIITPGVFLQYIINRKVVSIQNEKKQKMGSKLNMSITEYDTELNNANVSEYKKSILKRERLQCLLDACAVPPKTKDTLGSLLEPLYLPQPPVGAYLVDTKKNDILDSIDTGDKETTTITNSSIMEHSYNHRSNVVYGYHQYKLDEIIKKCEIPDQEVGSVEDTSKPSECSYKNLSNKNEKYLKIVAENIGIPWETILEYCPNVIQSARMRIYPPNTVIFAQNIQPRQYLYIVVGGECRYIRTLTSNSRTINKKLSANSKVKSPVRSDLGQDINNTSILNTQVPMTVDYDVGISLFGGDFSFMDGETTELSSSIRCTHNNVAMESSRKDKNESMCSGRDWIQERTHKHNEMLIRNKNYIPKTLHDYHKCSLISVSRVEMCCIPLVEIQKCKLLFKSLLQISNKKYSVLSMTDAEFQQYILDLKAYQADLNASLLEAQRDLISTSLPVHPSMYTGYLSKDDHEALRSQKKLHIATPIKK